MEIIACACDLWGLAPPDGPTIPHHHLDPVLGWKGSEGVYERSPDGSPGRWVPKGEPMMRWPEGWVEPCIWVDWKAVARALTLGKYTDPGKNWKGERQEYLKVGRRG